MGLPLFPFLVNHKYEAVKLLGKGGGGFAVLAKKKDQTVAIKLLNLTLEKEPQRVIQKFKKEFLTLKKLNHPHIGGLYDFGFDATLNLYYFVGEYIPGEDIRKACQTLSIEKIEVLFLQALQALHYLHTFGRAGLRHNDIKVANILVAQDTLENPNLKLIDFGLTSLAPLEMRGGTASYMAPEQILFSFPEIGPDKKLPKPDLRSDLYSLGVVWYFSLTGLNPFLIQGDTDATLKRHFDFVPPPPSSIKASLPPYLDTIILKLLKEKPEERYTCAAEVIQDLRYLSGKPYSVIPPPLRRYYLPEGEGIKTLETLRPLQEMWDKRLAKPPPFPEVVWIVGGKGQGKTKILEHFKNYVQSHEGHVALLSQNTKDDLEEWLVDLERLTQDFSQRLLIAVDDWDKDHPAARQIQTLFDKIDYTKHWEAGHPIPWLFVFTSEKKPALQSSLPSTTLTLKNFDREELREFVRRISPQKNISPPETFIQKLLDHTNGNPLFVTSILKVLGEKGLLWNEDGAWLPSLFEKTGIDFAKLPIPKDLGETLNQEWQLCDPKEKKILKWCACFPFGVPEDFAEGPPTIQKLIDLGTLEWDEKRRLRFKNSFFQKTVQGRLTPKEKQTLHEKIALGLKKRNRPSHTIAYHLALSSKRKVRLNALQTLAFFHTETGRYEEALEARKEEMALLAKETLPKKFDVAIHSLRLLKNLRQFEEAHQRVQEWLKKVPAGPNYKGWRAAFLREQGLLFLAENQFQKARGHFEEALSTIAKVKGRLKEKLILENMIARTWLDARAIDQAIAIYQRTREAAKSLKGDLAKEVLNNDLGYAYLLNQDSQALRYLEEDLKILKQAGDKIRLLRCHFLLGSASRKLSRNFSKAVQQYQKSLELAKDIKDYDWQMRALNGLAATYLDNAHEKGGTLAYQQALRHFEESLALLGHLKKDLSVLDSETAAIYLNIATCHQEMGNFSKAYDIFQMILTVLERKSYKESRDFVHLCETYIALSDNLACQGKYKEMEGPIQKAWAIAKSSKSLLEHQLALQILWAEWAKAANNFGELKNHLGLAEELQTKYHIQPTPLAKKRLEELKRGVYKIF